jgi:glycosyltransferase involved in cell wall biosynthesis
VNAAIIGERPTGLGLHALHVIRALHARDERLLVWTSRPDLLGGQGPRLERVPAALRPERGTRGHLLRLLWVQSGLRRRVRRSGADLLLNLMPEGVFRPPVPQIATVHDLLPLFYPAEYPRQQFYFRHYVPAVLRASAGVIVISESTRRDVERLYHVPADKIHVALCGYDRTRFSPDGAAQAGGNYALYVGNVMPHKNLLRLVEAFASASRRVPMRLVMRGTGRHSHVRALQARIDALGLGDCVDWRPYATPEELPPLYRGARMVLLPSLYEGFGLTALEAMACATPVIASNTSSLPEVVGDAGVLVDPYDTAALADAIARLAGDDRLVKELRERGVARARRFSWESAAGAIQGAIRRRAART